MGVKGIGNQQYFGMRIYDPLIVQQGKYSELSPYQLASNTPIMAIDLDACQIPIRD